MRRTKLGLPNSVYRGAPRVALSIGFKARPYRRSSNAIEYCKRIVDDIHSDFHNKPMHLEDANRSTFGVHFFNSVVVVEKLAQSPPMQIAVPS
jgi:hypothetical protein